MQHGLFPGNFASKLQFDIWYWKIDDKQSICRQWSHPLERSLENLFLVFIKFLIKCIWLLTNLNFFSSKQNIKVVDPSTREELGQFFLLQIFDTISSKMIMTIDQSKFLLKLFNYNMTSKQNVQVVDPSTWSSADWRALLQRASGLILSGQTWWEIDASHCHHHM